MVCGSTNVPNIRNIDPVEDPDKDTENPADYHEAIFVYNELEPIITRRYQQNTLVNWEIPVPVTIRLTEEPNNTKTILETMRTELERIFGIQVSGFACNTWDGPRNLTIAGKGFYEARYTLYLHQYGVAASGGWSGTGATGGSLWAAPVVLHAASALFSDEKLCQLTGTDTIANWTVTSALDVTGATVTGLTDAHVPNTITLDNLTQITTKSHTVLSDIGTNTHAALDTFKDTTYAAHDHSAGNPGTVAHSDTTGQGTDDHHAETHTFTSHSDITATLSGAELEDSISYLAANAAWYPCSTTYHNTYPIIQNANNWYFANVADPSYQRLMLPLPTVKGGLKLYVSGVRIGIFAGDANSYLELVEVNGLAYDGMTELDDSGAITAGNGGPELYTDTFTAVDCSPHEQVSVELTVTAAGAATDFKVSSVCLLCHYGE